MLALSTETPASWVAYALSDLGALLVDHAHCEKKAAGMAVNLLFRYPQWGGLLEPLSRLAREELAHFEDVLRVLHSRGMAFAAQRPTAYAGRLRQATRSHEPARLLDTLLCGALIEARSCERFGLLASHASDPELRGFYAGLLAAEARHHRVYLDLAAAVDEAGRARARLAELAEHEAAVLRETLPGPRMHSGHGDG